MLNPLKNLGIERSAVAPFWSVALNLLLVYVIYALLRAEFLLENLSYFKDSLGGGDLLRIFGGGAVFDTPGIFYTNALYILMMLLPLQWKEHRGYYLACHVVFTVINGLAVIVNLADSVYFPFTLRRTTWDVFSEFSNEGSLASIFAVEAARHWYLVLLAVALVWLLWKVYATPCPGACTRPLWRYYLLSVASLAVGALTAIGGIRGGFIRHWYLYLLAIPLAYAAWRIWHSGTPHPGRRRAAACACAGVAAALVIAAPIGGWRHRDIRPIALSNAAKYASDPKETALILNTPFAMIRTIGGAPFRHPGYFPDEASLAAVYTPEHPAAPGDSLGRGKNVVIFILESFGSEYFGALNKEILGEDYKGYTPFLDSLISRSATWSLSIDNSRKSIDGMPSILAAIPHFVKSFVLTPSAMNEVRGIPALLREQGYSTAFFHGARTGSMGFDGFARSIGFDNYYGREDFVKDGLAGGEEEFDGYWAIWDEPFLQYYALKMSQMKQPFMTALFTASSHHPFNIPEKYRKDFPDDPQMPIYKTIRYSDQALRRFFETASRQPWFENTIFVITNDHTNARAHDEYRSDIGAFYGPVIIYDPSGGIAPGRREGVAQQTDIMPTLLNYVGTRSGYVAFGADLLAAEPSQTWAVNYINEVYQYVKYGFVMQFDGQKAKALFRVGDHKMEHDVLKDHPQTAARMEVELKAIIQQYMDRMLTDRLTVSKPDQKK